MFKIYYIDTYFTPDNFNILTNVNTPTSILYSSIAGGHGEKCRCNEPLEIQFGASGS